MVKNKNYSETKPRTKDGFLEILFYYGNQVDNKTACGLGEGFLRIQVLSANTTPFLD